MKFSLSQQIVRALDILALEMVEKGRLAMLGEPPEWALRELLGLLELKNNAFDAAELSPFLENFLIDAEAFWQDPFDRCLRSGIWTERGQTGQELGLEAIALAIDRHRVILISAPTAATTNEMAWLQKARQKHLTFISEKKAVEAKLIGASLYDAASGLPNRAFFLSQLETRFEQCKKSLQDGFATVVLNIDRFRNINHNLGAELGDEVLSIVANKIRFYCLRRGDIPVRFCADEFGVLLHRVADESDALDIAYQIQRSISQPLELEGHRLRLTACLGIAIYDRTYTSGQDLLGDASIAMHEAKALGQNKCAIFDRNMRARALETWTLESDLRQAIELEQLEIHYQPIVSLDTMQVTGFEALIRWQHPTQGWVSPAKFVPLAERVGLIHEIDKWVFRAACRTLRAWHAGGRKSPYMNINVSALDFMDPDLPKFVRDMLLETQAAPNQIRLEITESSVLADTRLAASILAELRGMGLAVIIDDFGTGNASFSYLQSLLVDGLKIDGYFIEAMLSHGSDIVSAMIDLAHRLGIKVTAEKVETPEQMALLKSLDCDAAQGFLFSQPVPASEARSWIDATLSVDIGSNDTAGV